MNRERDRKKREAEEAIPGLWVLSFLGDVKTRLSKDGVTYLMLFMSQMDAELWGYDAALLADAVKVPYPIIIDRLMGGHGLAVYRYTGTELFAHLSAIGLKTPKTSGHGEWLLLYREAVDEGTK